MFRKFVILCLIFLATGKAKAEKSWDRLTRKLKPSVVSIDLSRSIAFSGGAAEYSAGTGFVVDASQGLVVTNQHVAGQSPLSSLDITFSNNRAATAKLIYYDPWHDFAFLQYDPKKIDFTPSQVEFGNYEDLKEGEEVLLIGNSSSQGLSMKIGHINRLTVVKGFSELWRHTHYIHVSLSRAGGASGAPVFNTQGKLIGIHSGGEETESFEMRADYVKDALKDIRANRIPIRGDALLSLVEIKEQKAIDHYKLPSRLLKKNQDQLLAISFLVPGTRSAEVLRQGDLLLSYAPEKQKEWTDVGFDLYSFDHFIDLHEGKKVRLKVWRDQKEVEVIVEVEDAQKGKIRKFATFGGSVFHDVNAKIAMTYHIPRDGVFISQSKRGGSTTFGSPGKDSLSPDNRSTRVTKIGKEEIHSLDDFIRVASEMKNEENTIFWIQNFNRTEYSTDWYDVTLDLKFDPLKVYEWREGEKDWIEVN